MAGRSLKYHPQSRAELSERGAILPLLLLLSIPLLALLAVVADLGIVMNANRDLEIKTRNAALSGLSAFQDQYRYLVGKPIGEQNCAQCNFPGMNCIPLCAFHAAKNRANNIAFANVSLGERFVSDRENLIDEFTPTSDPPPNGSPTESEIRLGVYYWLEPNECKGGQYGTPASWCAESYPSFRTVNLNSIPDVSLANAIELRATFPADNPITSIFASILGTTKFNVHAAARAAILPRNDMFIIDLSRSMYRSNYFLRNKPTTTYPAPEGSPGTAAEFAFLGSDAGLYPLGCNWWSSISARSACCAEFCDSDPGAEKCTTCTAAACDDYIAFGSGFSQDRIKFQALGLSPPYTPEDDHVLPSERHYQSHYRCVAVTTGWDGTVITRENYFFDFGTENAGEFLSRPEPLISVIEATNAAITNLRGRNMSVDRLGVIAFDDDQDNLIANNPRYLPPSPPNSPAVEQWRIATLPEKYYRPNDGFLSKSLFPFASAKSDIFQALREAAYLISLEPSYEYAKNTVNVITDGLQNCSYDRVAGGDWWSGWQRNGPCENTGARVVEGISNLIDEAFVDELVRRKISVNVILFGQEVRPHRLVRKNAYSTGCYDQIGDNDAGAPPGALVDSGWSNYLDLLDNDIPELNSQFSLKSADAPFLAANQLYEGLVAKTKGLWLPVIEPLMVSGSTIIFWNELQTACQNAGDTEPLRDLEVTVPDPDNPGGTMTVVVTDSAGRLLFDPLGESVSGQMRRFVDQIVQSPYVVVP